MVLQVEVLLLLLRRHAQTRFTNRSCAVNGGTYMLGKPVQSIQLSEHVDSQPSGYSVTIEGIPNSILVSCIIWPDTPTEVLNTSCPSPEKSIIRGIVVVDQPVWILDSHGDKIAFGDGVDNVTMVFDPSYIAEGSKDGSFVTCFLTGHSTMSCPKGQGELSYKLPSPPP